MKRFAVALVLLAWLGWLCPSAEGNQKRGLSQLMIDKLRHAQGLLQGIALADFNKITASAEELITLSRTAEWFAFKTPRYEVLSNDFQRAAEVIIQKAKARNMDGVVLAYMDLTKSCVHCHQYMREVRDARGPDPLPNLGVLVQNDGP
jgi:hypothetical protein